MGGKALLPEHSRGYPSLGIMKNKNSKRFLIIFSVSLAVIAAIFATAVIRTTIFNNESHSVKFSGSELFSTDGKDKYDVSVSAAPRSSTWGKIFDFNNEGLTENNFQAYTYDFTISNNTKYEVRQFTFKLTFSHDAYLASAWNGALEFHQSLKGGKIVATVPDLRVFNPDDYPLDVFRVDGEPFVVMHKDDYLIYYPSETMNALEMPIKAHEGTTPGIIMYVEIGESIEDSTLELDYKFHKLFITDTLFWISMVGLLIWFLALVIYIITTLQIKKYNERHERDNIIITESIETFTGFIDAKDPYTNGHSKRVAMYTRMLAKELGYEGEELDRIYYIALLHDCGKIGVPDNILGKPGKLTAEEFEIIKSHTVRGGEILSSFKSLKNAGEGARYHHERYDGKGYPEGLAGENIPLIARIICVADSFDAMNSNRVYRKKLTSEYIISELENNKGAQFDPKIADIMLNLIKSGKIKLDD